MTRDQISMPASALLLAGLLFTLTAGSARAGLCDAALDGIVAVQTCRLEVADGELCENDWVECTVRATMSRTETRARIDIVIPGSFFQMWQVVQSPGGNNVSQRENVFLNPNQTGRYAFNQLDLVAPGDYDFIYRAQVRDDVCLQLGDQGCMTAQFTFTSLNKCESNQECVDYNCAPPGAQLAIEKTLTSTVFPIVVGTPLEWTVTIRNVGTAADSNVTLVDDMTANSGRFLDPLSPPGSVTYSRAPDTDNSAPYLIDVGWNQLDPGETLTIIIQTEYNNCTPATLDGFCNTAIANGASLTGPCAANGLEARDCQSANPGGSLSNLTATKAMVDTNGSPLAVGDVLHITLTFDNSDICLAGSLQMRDVLDQALDFVPGSEQISPQTGNFTYNALSNTVTHSGFDVPDVNNGGQLTIEWDVVVNNTFSGGAICNFAEWRSGVVLTPWTPTNTVCLDGGPCSIDAQATASASGICLGDTATFNAGSSMPLNCNGTLTYQWYVDTLPVPGETNPTFTTDPALTAGNHTIDVEVGCTDPPTCSGRLMPPLQLQVEQVAVACDPPTASGPAGSFIPIGQTSSTVGGTTFQWTDSPATGLFNNATTLDMAEYQNATAGVYTLTLTATTDFGSFSCSDSCDVVVTVGGGPGCTGVTAAATPVTATVCEGGTATFDASGSINNCPPGGNLLFQWLENGTPLPGEINPTYTTDPSLLPGAYTYDVEVTCDNDTSCSDRLDPPIAFTVEATPEPVPLLTAIRSPGPTDVQFDWQPAVAGFFRIYSVDVKQDVPMNNLAGVGVERCDTPDALTLTCQHLAASPTTTVLYYNAVGVCAADPTIEGP